MRPAIRKVLVAVLLLILFPLSCGVLVPAWRSYEMNKIIRPVEGEARRDFPVALFRTDAHGMCRVQLVLYGDLRDEMKKSRAGFLAPRAGEKELQEQLLKATALETGNFNDPFEMSFAVEEDREGMQVLRVSFAADDDDVNTGWYEARADGIKPLRHQRAFGPLFGMKIIAEAFGTAVVLWIAGRSVLKRARNIKTAGASG